MRQSADVDGTTLPGLDVPNRARPAPHVRDRRRVEQWNVAVGRLTGFKIERAQSPDDVARIEAEHAEEVRRGPAFARMRRGCGDETPPAVTDRNALDRMLRWLADVEREAFKRDRAWSTHEGSHLRRSITRTVRPVLLALVGLAKRFGTVFPSLERLAALALSARRTVVRALERLEALGLVRRVRRRKVVATPYGRRQVQTTNAYTLALPTELPAAAAARLSAAEGRPDALVDQSAKIDRLNPKDRGKSEEPPCEDAQKGLSEWESVATPIQLAPNEPPEQPSEPPEPLPKVVTPAVDWQSISRAALEAKRARSP